MTLDLLLTISVSENMNVYQFSTCLGVLLCFLATVTMTVTASLEDIEEDAALNFPPNIRYFLNNMKNDGLALQAPPHVYMNKLKRYYDEKTKRNGFWIWMPAQGYVSVPSEQLSEGSKNSGGNANVLRYG